MADSAASAGEPAATRLAALLRRQRAELDRMQAQAAAREVMDLARGILMERLSCSAAEAGRELDRIAAASGSTPADLAAEIAGQHSPLAGQETVPAPAPGVVAAVGALAPDATALAVALLDEALADSGAAAVAIWMIAPDGALDLVGQAGLDLAEASRWQRVPPAADTPAMRAAAGRGLTWWSGDGDRRAGPGFDQAPGLSRWPGGARAVVPVEHEGVRLGALEVCWPGRLTGPEAPLRRQVAGLAELCAQALARRLPGDLISQDPRAAWVLGLLDGLADSVLFAIAIRDEAGQVADFRIVHLSPEFADPARRPAADIAGRSLLEAYPATARAGGLVDRAAEVLSSGRPQYLPGEQLVASAPDEQAVRVNAHVAPLFDGVAITWLAAAESDRLAALLEHAQRLGRIGGWEELLDTGAVHWTEPTFALFGGELQHPVRLAELHQRVPAEDVPTVESFRARLLLDKMPATAAFRVIRGDDESVRQLRAFAEPVLDAAGTPVAIHGVYQDVSARYHTEMALAVTRDQLTDSEQRAAEEHQLALRLQRAITPLASRPVATPGLAVTARYRPAGAANLVGGDWYDAMELPAGKVMLTVGDVAGHGIDAVTGMVTLRNSLRGLALTGAGPAALLGLLNSVAYHLTDNVLGTAVCGLYDPVTRELQWARAGHLSPVLVRAGLPRQLTPPRGTLLGADATASYPEVTVTLQEGDVLLLFSDGLVERKDEPIDESLAALLRTAAGPVEDLEDYADMLVRESKSDTGDDACLLVVGLRS
ncbi:MAG TPA: SpoIIE family protein phosphatase [Streptosporangiaceae bacterium]